MLSNDSLTQLFPQLNAMIVKGITYLDSAATSLKLKASADLQHHFDLYQTANIHRGAHQFSDSATQAYEDSRILASKYLNCSPKQIVFTKGTTDSLNLLAHHYSKILTQNDCILLTEMEHHSNLLPWQHVSNTTGAKLLFTTVNKKGELNLSEIGSLLKKNNIKLFSLCHVSNTLGTVNPVNEISKLCESNKTDLIIDGAQAVTFLKPNLNALKCDFYAFSAHKSFGSFGVGILFVKNIAKLNLYQLGGGIVTNVDFNNLSFVTGPQKFESGTPNISGVIALKEVFKFLNSLDFKDIQKEEKKLLNYTQKELSKIKGFKPVGSSDSRVNILSFNFKNIHPSDLCELLDEQGVALRSGNHCTQPLLKKLGLSACIRASFSIYNSKKDADKLIKAIKKSLKVLQ